ncbi:MAG: hypothetical protein NVS3B12_12000 [Acidimicrobiales bacterium]
MSPADIEAPVVPGTLRRIVEAFRHIGLLAVAGGAANAANVVVTVIIARLLTTREYGGVAQLVGVFVVLSMPGSALLVGVVRKVTALEAAGRHDELDAWVVSARRRTLAGLTGFAVVAVVARAPLGHLLGLPGPDGVTEVLVAGGGWTLLSVERGLLQSRQAYGRLARNLAVEGASRTIVTLGLVVAGLGIEATSLGLLAAMGACVVDARLSLAAGSAPRAGPGVLEEVARAPVPAPESIPPADLDPLPSCADPVAGHLSRPRVRGTIPRLSGDLAVAAAALGLLAILQYSDVVIIGRRSAGQAGSYAAISVACKALVFGAIVLSGYLLPEAVWRWHHGRHALGPLAAAVAILALPAFVLGVAAFAIPDQILRLVFGPGLVHAAMAFGPLAVAMTALAVSVLMTNYLLGIGRRRVVAVLVVAAAGIALALARGAATPTAVVQVELIGQLGLCGVLTAMVVTGRPGPSTPPRT